MSGRHIVVSPRARDVVVVGGCGRVGLPLALSLAGQGLHVASFDTNDYVVRQVMSGVLPFREDGAGEVLTKVLASGAYTATSDPRVMGSADTIVMVIGTPVDEHLSPDPEAVPRALAEMTPFLSDGQLLILRSTVYPGVTKRVERLLREHGLRIEVAFCPERIAEGTAMTELFTLPQLVAAREPATRARAAKLFARLTPTIVELEPEEAELAKLFTNSWRYIKFAAANQFYAMANDHGVDFERVRHAVTYDYPRAADLPGAGFAAGPCLFKDTMQLAAYSDNAFALGHSAMLVNEGLPLYLVSRLEARYDLSECTVGILGTAFKAESDDTRSSLAYKLKRILKFRAAAVIATDPFVTTDESLLPLADVVQRADVLVIAAPHKVYRDLITDKPVVDVWNLLGRGVRV